MSDYVIKGQTSDSDGRLVIIDEATWTVEVDEQPMPNYESFTNHYYAEVTNSKKLVFIRRTDGQVKAYGNVDPIAFWDEKTDDTFWQSGTLFSWNGSAWVADNSGGGTASNASLSVPLVATWDDNYRPMYAKVEYTLSGGGDLPNLDFIGCCGRDTTSNSSSAVEPVASGEGILLLKLWEGKDNISSINFSVPAGETLTVTGIYFSKHKFNEYVCDGYSSELLAFDNATALTGTEPDFTGSLEIIGVTTPIVTNQGTYASAYRYNGGSFTVNSMTPLTITVESSTPGNTPWVSIYSDRDTKVAGIYKSGTNTTTFNWTPPATGSYVVVVYNKSSLPWGEQCDTFDITIASAGGGSVECEAYTAETMHDNAATELVFGQETTYNVDYSGSGDRLAIEMPTLSGTDENLVVNADADGSFKIVAYEKTVDPSYNWTDDYCDPQWGIPSHGSYIGSELVSATGYSSPVFPPSWGEDGCTVEFGTGTAGSTWNTNFTGPGYIKVTFTGDAQAIYWSFGADRWGNPSPSVYYGPDHSTIGPVDSGYVHEVGFTDWGTLMTFDALADGQSFTITAIEFGDFAGNVTTWTGEVEVTSSGNNVISALIPTTDTNYDFLVNDYRLGIINTEGTCIEANLTVTASGASGASEWTEHIETNWMVDYGSPTPTPGYASEDTGPGGQVVKLMLPYELYQAGFMPEKVRFNFTGQSSLDFMYQTDENYMGVPYGTITPGEEVTISYESPNDAFIVLNLSSTEGSFEIISIEFLFEPVECANHSSAAAAIADPYATSSSMYDSSAVDVNPGKYAAIEVANGGGGGFYQDVYCMNTTANTDFDVYVFDASGTQQGWSNGTGLGGEHVAYLPIPETDPIYFVIHNDGGSECCNIEVQLSPAT